MKPITKSLLKSVYKHVGYLFFVANGKKPWTFGYQEYKEKHLKKVLSAGSFNPQTLPCGYGNRIDERIVEYPWLLSRLPSGRGKLLDAGSALNFDFILAQSLIAEKNLFISTLAPESVCFWEKGISYVFEDLRETCYKDNYFDFVVSLSTIEHIGMDNTFLYTSDIAKKENNVDAYIDAIREFCRIVRPGGRLYLSVPFGKHKNHGWFQVFDAEMVDKVISAFSPTTYNEYHYRYEPDGWVVSSRAGSIDATCFDINAQKEHDSDFAAFSRAIVCLEMVK